MIDWPRIKAALSTLIVGVAELDADQVKWKNEAEGGTWHHTPTVYLSVSPIARQGIEEEILSGVFFDPNDQAGYPFADQQATLVGQRRFSVEVRVESFEQDIASNSFSGNIANQIAIRIMRSTSHEFLRGICAIEYRQPTHFIRYTDNDDRLVSCYVFELMMRTADVDQYNQSWIGDTKVSSTDDIGENVKLDVSIFNFPTP